MTSTPDSQWSLPVTQLLRPPDGVTNPGAIHSLEIRQEFGRHTLAFVQLTGQLAGNRNRQTWPEGSPVALGYGSTGDTDRWYGYVHHAEFLRDRSAGTPQAQTFSYVLIGTSWPLNCGHVRSWRSVTDSYITRRIALGAGLSPVTDTTPIRHRYLAQSADQSDWQFLLDRAAENGYRLHIDGPDATLLHPRTYLAGGLSNDIPTYWFGHQVADVTRFEMIAGTQTPVGGVKATRTVYGLDRTTGRTVAATSGTGTLKQIKNPRPAASFGEARALARAESAANADWLVAEADLRGSPRLRPGRLIRLVGQALPRHAEGTWLITAARHRLGTPQLGDPLTGFYNTQVRLVRNRNTGYTTADVHNASTGGGMHLVPDPDTGVQRWIANIQRPSIHHPHTAHQDHP